MTVSPVRNTVCTFKEFNNNLDDLFKLAEKGNWKKAFSEVEKNPHLLNAKDKDGITILLLAAVHLSVENQDQDAFYFIDKAFTLSKNSYIHLDVNASCKGISVFWMLVAHIGNEALKGDWYKSDLIDYCLSYFNCNVNAAPEEGPYTGVTAYSILIQDLEFIPHPGLYSHNISDSVLPKIGGMTVPAALISLIYSTERDPEGYHKEINSRPGLSYNAKKILKLCYDSVIQIIEENPDCDVNAMTICPKTAKPDKSLLEAVAEIPPSPNQHKLLHYLIFVGAKK